MLPRLARSARAHAIVLGAGFLALTSGASLAAGPVHEMRAGGGISYGVDSNPLELPGEPRSGTFRQGDFQLGLSPAAGRRFGLVASASGMRRDHESALRDADEGWADLRGGLAAVPYVNGSRKISIAGGGTFATYLATLVDPDTGEVWEQPARPSGSIPIPDRLDFQSRGAFLDLRWQAGRNLLFYLDAEASRRSYFNDYEEADGLHPLDDRASSVEPGVRARIHRIFVVDVSWNRMVRRYDELPAIEEDASEAEARREYLYARYQASLKMAPGGGWEFLAGMRSTQRSDEHAGYYDSDGTSSLLSVGFAPTQRTQLRLSASLSRLDYPNAPVGTNADGETRESELRRILAHAEHALPAGLKMFLQAGKEGSEDRDPAYTYARRWVQAGVKLEAGR